MTTFDGDHDTETHDFILRNISRISSGSSIGSWALEVSMGPRLSASSKAATSRSTSSCVLSTMSW